MGAQKIEVCPSCLDPRLGGNDERTWCMNTDCAYTWLTFERKGSAKMWNRVRQWWWFRVERELGVAFWRAVYSVVRFFKRNGSAKNDI